jgi:hypothetical protein
MSKRRSGKRRELRARAGDEAKGNQGAQGADGRDRKRTLGQRLLACLPFQGGSQSAGSRSQSNSRPGWRSWNPFVVPPLGGRGARKGPPEGGAANLTSGARGATSRGASVVRSKAEASRRRRVVGLVAVVLIVSCIVTSGILAGRGSFRSVVATHGSRLPRSPLQSGSATPTPSPNK